MVFSIQHNKRITDREQASIQPLPHCHLHAFNTGTYMDIKQVAFTCILVWMPEIFCLIENLILPDKNVRYILLSAKVEGSSLSIS